MGVYPDMIFTGNLKYTVVFSFVADRCTSYTTNQACALLTLLQLSTSWGHNLSWSLHGTEY